MKKRNNHTERTKDTNNFFGQNSTPWQAVFISEFFSGQFVIDEVCNVRSYLQCLLDRHAFPFLLWDRALQVMVEYVSSVKYDVFHPFLPSNKIRSLNQKSVLALHYDLCHFESRAIGAP
jgi:hypothetical protein